MTEAFPRITLDRMKGFGQICPPETLLCAGGKSIPAALREENPSEYQLFHREALEAKQRVVPQVRCYEQDGFSFDADGILIEETLDEDARARALRGEAERKAKIAARRAHAAYMREQGFEDSAFVGFGDEKPVTASDVAGRPGESETGGAPKLDLIAWAQGKLPTQFFAVKKAFREQHGFDPADKEQALGFLVENGMISANAVG